MAQQCWNPLMKSVGVKQSVSEYCYASWMKRWFAFIISGFPGQFVTVFLVNYGKKLTLRPMLMQGMQRIHRQKSRYVEQFTREHKISVNLQIYIHRDITLACIKQIYQHENYVISKGIKQVELKIVYAFILRKKSRLHVSPIILFLLSIIVALTFALGRITTEPIFADTQKIATCVNAMRWRITICHFRISTTKRDSLGLNQ